MVRFALSAVAVFGAKNFPILNSNARTLDVKWFGGCRLVGKGHHRTSLHAPRADAQAQRPEPFPFAICIFKALRSTVTVVGDRAVLSGIMQIVTSAVRIFCPCNVFSRVHRLPSIMVVQMAWKYDDLRLFRVCDVHSLRRYCASR